MRIPNWIFLNFFTKAFISQTESFPFVGNRIKSMLVDFAYVTSVFFPWIIIIALPFIILTINNSENQTFFNLYITVALIPYTLTIMALLNKDLCNGKSIGKRIYGYQIIDSQTKETAGEYKCMLRNITMIIWPIEAIVIMINPSKRIGDLIAGTEIIKINPELKETFLEELRNKRGISTKLILTSLGIAMLMNLISLAFSNF